MYNLANRLLPPIPENYRQVKVPQSRNHAFVIERIEDGSQFVWIPKNFDGKTVFDEDFTKVTLGRRLEYGKRYLFKNGNIKNKMDILQYHEEVTTELLKQYVSVNYYGGFYISRFNISKGDNGKPLSVRGKKPWDQLMYNEAIEIANSFENGEMVKSHLPFGAEYNAIFSFFEGIKCDYLSTNCSYIMSYDPSLHGNFRVPDLRNPRITSKLKNTGMNENYCVYDIYDIFGNVREMTQEKLGEVYRVSRGGAFTDLATKDAAIKRCYFNPNEKYYNLGFRIVLWISPDAKCTYFEM